MNPKPYPKAKAMKHPTSALLLVAAGLLVLAVVVAGASVGAQLQELTRPLPTPVGGP